MRGPYTLLLGGLEDGGESILEAFRIGGEIRKFKKTADILRNCKNCGNVSTSISSPWLLVCSRKVNLLFTPDSDGRDSGQALLEISQRYGGGEDRGHHGIGERTGSGLKSRQPEGHRLPRPQERSPGEGREERPPEPPRRPPPHRAAVLAVAPAPVPGLPQLPRP